MLRSDPKEAHKDETEVTSVAAPSTSTTIKLSVGGTRFETTLATLCRFPNSLFSGMFSVHHTLSLDPDDYYFIDRDGTHFRHILNFLRYPETFEVGLTGIALKELKTECAYYRLTEYMFPSVAVPPFTVYSMHVQQNAFGIFSINNKPVLLCMYCDSADSGAHEFLPSFKRVVKGKGGVLDPAQPCIQAAGNICRFCSR